mmetsp:Transcript_29169/g.78276  ORF Transcript_29169/g.78276 Transcript_29169/m.78276 type:complete len:221 (-) Transcript_29169:625-1287(-)
MVLEPARPFLTLPARRAVSAWTSTARHTHTRDTTCRRRPRARPAPSRACRPSCPSSSARAPYTTSTRTRWPPGRSSSSPRCAASTRLAPSSSISPTPCPATSSPCSVNQAPRTSGAGTSRSPRTRPRRPRYGAPSTGTTSSRQRTACCSGRQLWLSPLSSLLPCQRARYCAIHSLHVAAAADDYHNLSSLRSHRSQQKKKKTEEPNTFVLTDAPLYIISK